MRSGKLDAKIITAVALVLSVGDGMMGVFRWLKKDKAWIYEMLAFREEGGWVNLDEFLYKKK